MKFKILILLVLVSTISFGNDLPDENFHFVVKYFMLSSLDMRMKIFNDVIYEGKPSKRIEVTTKTKKLYNKIFSIDNYYSTYYNQENYSCQYHKKLIQQPNVEQELYIEYKNGKAHYSIGEIRDVGDSVLDFFSLLMYTRTLDTEDYATSQVTIDMEGELFDVTFDVQKEEFIKVGGDKILTEKVNLIYKKQIPGQESILDYTDIFFWKIAEEGGDKFIWVEKGGQRRIVKARFSEGRSWLEARLVEDW